MKRIGGKMIKGELVEQEEAIKEKRKDKIYQLLTYFLVFSFFGWVFETLAVYVLSGKLTDRGYFFIGPRFSNYIVGLDHTKLSWVPIVWGLPAIEMYGFGGLLIVVALRRFKDRILPLFVFGALLMTLFELLGSYWCEYILHHEYWNYNHEFLNFQGRICLQSTIAWGVLSVFVIQFIEPATARLYTRIKKFRHYRIVILNLTVYMIICALIKYVFFKSIIPN